MSKRGYILDTAIFYTRNLDTIVDFYIKVLGLSLERRDGARYASFDLGNGPTLGIKVANKERELPGAQTIILATTSLGTLYETLKAKNLTFAKELVQESWGLTFSILDPDGNKVEFVEQADD